MPIFIYWGNDSYAINRAYSTLRSSILASEWAAFNYTKYSHESPDLLTEALQAALTTPLGRGQRLIWLENTTLLSACNDNQFKLLQRTVEKLPATTVLLLTTEKVDWRLKSSKLLKQYAVIKEFSLIPAWQTEDLVRRVANCAAEVGVKLTPDAIRELTEAVSNDTRALYTELEKLKIYQGDFDKPLSNEVIRDLVTTNTTTSLQLADYIRTGNTTLALRLI